MITIGVLARAERLIAAQGFVRGSCFLTRVDGNADIANAVFAGKQKQTHSVIFINLPVVSDDIQQPALWDKSVKKGDHCFLPICLSAKLIYYFQVRV